MKKRDIEKQKLLLERKEPVNRLQNFWAEALINHQVIGDLISDEDMEILEFMNSLDIRKSNQSYSKRCLMTHKL